ncbi:MAG: RNA 2',3'-cyclic phosphodiesterase [Pirellulales bacterium]
MQSRVRTFVAVEIGLDIRARATRLIAKLKTTGADVRWVEPDKLHLTLKFLGDVERNDIPAVCNAVLRAAAEVPPFDLESHGVGAFPDLHHPRTIWMGIGQGEAEMAALQAGVEQALADEGYRPEARRFRPHLTLGRVRGARGADELAAELGGLLDYFGGAMSVDEVIVFSSTLDRRGPTYEPLATAELRG